MPRLTNRDYLTIRHFLTRLWDQDDGHSYAALPGYAQRELHDFYAPTVYMTDEDAVWCDMLIGAINDFNTPAMQFAFKQNRREASKDLDVSLKKFGNHFKFRLTQNGGQFLVGKSLSSADILLAEALTSFIEFSPDCLVNYPCLMEFRNRIVSEPNIKSYLTSTNRWRLPDDQYVIDVAKVLRRPLPLHFEQRHRFVQN